MTDEDRMTKAREALRKGPQAVVDFLMNSPGNVALVDQAMKDIIQVKKRSTRKLSEIEILQNTVSELNETIERLEEELVLLELEVEECPSCVRKVES